MWQSTWWYGVSYMPYAERLCLLQEVWYGADQGSPPVGQAVADESRLPAVYSKLENALPYNSERDILKEQANAKLRERVLSLLQKDEGVELPIIPPVESKRMTREELEEIKAVKIKMLSTILDKLAVPPTTSPVQARNFAMASKPVGIRLAWVCNYKHAMHSSPCGCAKPHLGGKWVVLGKNSTEEIKDDK